jgi:hypothetical protein
MSYYNRPQFVANAKQISPRKYKTLKSKRTKSGFIDLSTSLSLSSHFGILALGLADRLKAA